MYCCGLCDPCCTLPLAVCRLVVDASRSLFVVCCVLLVDSNGSIAGCCASC